MNTAKYIILSGLLSLSVSVGHSATMQIYSDIHLGPSLQISANFLCQDGVYIYFKSKQDCLDSRKDWTCSEDLMVKPIREVEMILTEVGGPSVTRFFKVDTEYKYQQVERDSRGTTYNTIDEYRDLPYCAERTKLEPGNVGEFRYPASTTEKHFIEAMLEAGVTMINLADAGQSILDAIDLGQQSQEEKKASEIKTPYCNQSVTSEYIHLLSGEYSGNGIQNLNFEDVQVDRLQEISQDLFVTPSEFQDNRPAFEISCKKTWDI